MKLFLIREMRINDDYNSTLLSDDNGSPIVFYHSYEDEDNLDADMIWLSISEKFSKEFGENTDAYYLNVRKPYITEDGVLRDADENVIMFEGEPAGIGYLDAIPEKYLLWYIDNFDCVMDVDMEFVIVFDRDCLVPAE